MIAGFGWPDIVIVVLLGLGVLKGYSRGFIGELGGIAALAAGLIAPWHYNGQADATIENLTKAGPGPAHTAGMVLTGVFAYVVVLVIAAFLARIAKLPLLGLGNALAGAIAGGAKAAVLVWVLLFAASLFVLPADVRDALHASRLVPYFTQFDAAIDGALLNVAPPFARPLLEKHS